MPRWMRWVIRTYWLFAITTVIYKCKKLEASTMGQMACSASIWFATGSSNAKTVVSPEKPTDSGVERCIVIKKEKVRFDEFRYSVRSPDRHWIFQVLPVGGTELDKHCDFHYVRKNDEKPAPVKRITLIVIEIVSIRFALFKCDFSSNSLSIDSSPRFSDQSGAVWPHWRYQRDLVVCHNWTRKGRAL